MKRLIYILLTVATMTGCRIDTGDVFEPTALGYRLFNTTHEAISRDSKTLVTLMRFNEYLTAPTDEQREKIHSKHFYTNRIFEAQEGEWHIVYPNSELIIVTGGKTLTESGSMWFFHTKTFDSLDATLSLERLDTDGAKDGARFEYMATDNNIYTVDIIDNYNSFDGTELVSYTFVYTVGRGLISRYSGTTYFEILEPVTWKNASDGNLYGGLLKLWCYDDSSRYDSQASPSEFGNRVLIYFGDYQKEYYQ